MSRLYVDRVALGLTAAVLASCGGAPPPPPPPPPVHVVATPVVAPALPADPLGPRPTVATPAPFEPPKPVVYAGPNGMTVWLIERHTLPFVAVTVSVPTGSSSDPKGKGGVADSAADMMDEGAGTRGAIELSRAVDTLGATIGTGAGIDETSVSLTVLKKNLTPAFAILGDVVSRPRFGAEDWKRVVELRQNELRERASEPDETARVVARVAMFGPDHPYGHPVDGTLESSRRISLADAKAFYRAAWRPDRAVVVAVGDVTRDELSSLLSSAFGGWTLPATPAPPIVTPAPPAGPFPRAVLVDRPDAPQSVIALVRPGVSASDPATPALSRVNAALGGSFTSRLNQDLREEHGWSYGAHSRVSAPRGVGMITAGASVVTDKTIDALKAMLSDVETYSAKGLTDEEVEKTRSQARADLVSAYEGAGTVAGRLATDAMLGLPADYEATASIRRDTATKEMLDRLAAQYFDPTHAMVVVVGPRAKLEGPLGAMGFSQLEIRDANGELVKR